MPRWPLTVSSSPSGPWTMATLGVSRVRLRKLRPLLGSPSTTSGSIRVAASTREGSTSGASPVISTAASWMVPSCSGRSTVSPSRNTTAGSRASVAPTWRARTS